MNWIRTILPFLILIFIGQPGNAQFKKLKNKLKNKTEKMNPIENLPNKAKSAIKQIERQMSRADKAYEENDHYDLEKNVKYLKKNLATIKKVSPDYNTSDIENKISDYEKKLEKIKPAEVVPEKMKTPGRAPTPEAEPRDPLDFSSSKLQPTITMKSLLYYYGMQLKVDGTLLPQQFNVGFLPNVTTSGQKPNYGPFLKDHVYVTADVVNVKSQEIKNTFHYVGMNTNPFNLFTFNKNKSQGYTPEVKLSAGSYEMQFKVDDKLIYKFPFSVIEKVNSNPYAAMSKVYFIDGPWRNWAYIEVNSSGYPTFNFYALNDDPSIKNAARPSQLLDITWRTRLYYNGKYIGTGRINVAGDDAMDKSSISTGVWTPQGGQFYQYPRTKSKTPLKLSDYKDGSYYVELEMVDVAGKKSVRKFPFTVKGGKFEPSNQADRSKHKDLLTIIEGAQK